MNDESEASSKPPATEQSQKEDVLDELSAPNTCMIYEVIRRDGEEELNRPTPSLIWSGIAAGVLISFSVLGEAIFRTYLPKSSGSFLIENLGYSLGFLLVILGRMQLFTENTITTILPLIVEFKRNMIYRVARLWTIVLLANVVGAFLITALYALTPAIPSDLTPAMISLSEHAVKMPPIDGFFRAIPAGILIAAIVWMIPQYQSSVFLIVLVFTWLIAAGDFTHIVAGSVEMAYLIWLGNLQIYDAIFGFFLPVLAGNVVGGTLIFSFLVWGQVKDEID
uniref:formate/nitrite transporter family protein n=1 Tax=Ningiella ruwaisensis TaxID=2364274 RepID=UPI00109F254A|nr:formate/nitrite transporter family protein [Ningiella ruwaisensis]